MVYRSWHLGWIAVRLPYMQERAQNVAVVRLMLFRLALIQIDGASRDGAVTRTLSTTIVLIADEDLHFVLALGAV